MYESIDYENITPIELMNFLKLKNDKIRINKILDLGIFKIVNKELHIQSYKCVTTKSDGRDTKQFKKFFPFNHQVFWFALMEMKDLDFAISETKRILQGERQYTFPNGNMVQLCGNKI